MRPRRRLGSGGGGGVSALLLLGIAQFLFPTAALAAAAGAPAVSVGLKASWNGAPFLVELLETIASEHSGSYFPLLDRIASGAFANTTSDHELYTSFLRTSQAAGFLLDPADLSSFNLALSLRAAAPRIEAHYHYYETSLVPRMGKMFDPACAAWVLWSSKQTCEMEGEYGDMVIGQQRFPNDDRALPFERALETVKGRPAAILYADIQAPEFRQHHERLVRYAKAGHVSYRVRYRPPVKRSERPVVLSGYGVSLVLKKTDYMVMDDRDVEGGSKDPKVVEEKGSAAAAAAAQQSLGGLEDSEMHDIKPLQKEDLAGLGYKAASVVMGSKDPFATLERLVQDFPKHAATIAASEVNENVTEELRGNWEMFAGPGKNLIWINGLQMEESQMTAFALLEHLRRERKNINGFNYLGLDSSEAIRLLTHSILTQAKEEDKVQRFDYRDDVEGGDVIVWMNDLEKDARYAEWSKSPSMLLRRVFPGQLHPLRKNLHNLVLPVDFTDKDDLSLISRNIRIYIQRKIALRFGLVPLTKTRESADQAKVVYYLADRYGLETALKYIDTVLENNDFSKPSKSVFDGIQAGAKLRDEKTVLSLEDALADADLKKRIYKSKQWNNRLGINAGSVPHLFVNGQPVPKDDDWSSAMSEKLQGDVMVAARYVYENEADEDTDFVEVMLNGAAKRRNAHIFPESEADVKVINVAAAMEDNKKVFGQLPRIDTDKSDSTAEASVWVIGDFDEQDGYDLLAGAVELQTAEAGVSLMLINNPELNTEKPSLSSLLYQLRALGFLTPETLRELMAEVNPKKGFAGLDSQGGVPDTLLGIAKQEGWSYPDHLAAGKFWVECRPLLDTFGIAPGQKAIIVNGRVIGPIPREEPFDGPAFKQLLEYEHAKRIKPVLKAAAELGVVAKLKNGHLGYAALTSLVALTSTSEVSSGLFQAPDAARTDIPNQVLKGEHTAITLGDLETAAIRIVAAIDPASETAQKWIPLLKALSQMHGVHLKMFLNPAKTINELPVKRFYRHVFNSKPEFDAAGQLTGPRARFENIPQEPLLSLSMDVPPSWLVTPKESVHDLDNLKLASLKERLRGGDIEATYELENILIEGHSRDAQGQPPRGAQLVLGTEKEPHFADTIIMANLGYFQFKANPGMWNMRLKEGRSREIFKIDSFGSKGAAGEDSDIALMSFQGATLFPKMSRNPGMEDEDVLEPPTAKGPVDTAKKWFSGILHSATTTDVVETKPQADINIFSVASGHLYERFLGIMMLSVMKNTNHTVKFWFIENFLSPSFKDFIPIMAKEYNFQYELVTYKWPHWLRPQTEKQREIWGYKILFLDVLFPLDLHKVIFVDADQIVRTDLHELVTLDLDGAPYGFTPMCDSRSEIEGFRFWKQGYWKTFLQGAPYHISALYVVDLVRFRQLAAGDRLRQQYHQLSADPASLANLDQDLPNHMQSAIPIKSLPQDWLWCETWCSDESLKTAKTIDLCNNPMTKEPKLDRARRQVPEWTAYDSEVAELARRKGGVRAGHLAGEAEVKKEEVQKEEVKKEEVKDEL